MKKLLAFILCVSFIFCAAACDNTADRDLGKISFLYAFDGSVYVPETEEQFGEYLEDFIQYEKEAGYYSESVSFKIAYDKSVEITDKELAALNAVSVERSKTEGLFYPGKMNIYVSMAIDGINKNAIMDLTANEKIEKIEFIAMPQPSNN